MKEIKFCVRCDKPSENYKLDVEGETLIYVCEKCCCVDCGKPLSDKPDNTTQTHFCNTFCYARYKGL